MTLRRSSKDKPPEIAIEINLDERLLDFAFSDQGTGDPERLLIEMEEDGDLIITVTEDEFGRKRVELYIEE
jgi:hypothetical protein